LKRNIFGKYARVVAGIYRGQCGMTGLETAIILIAFVTVAAVFGYAVLSAGLFSAERGKETVYAGLAQAKANMELAGSVIVTTDNDADPKIASEIRFIVRNAIAGTPIDMTEPGDTLTANRCIMSLTTNSAYFNNIPWSREDIGFGDNDDLLESGEHMEITIILADVADEGVTTGVWRDLIANDWFNIQLKPMLGSTMTIQRTLPAGLDDMMDLH
jgi:flagellin FlaB